MSRRPPASVSDLPTALRRVVAQDRFVPVALVGLGLTVLAYLVPLSPALHSRLTLYGAPIGFLTLCVASLYARRGTIEDPVERRFWDYLALAMGVWLGVRIVAWIVPDLDRGGAYPDTLGALAFAIHYLLLIFAAERQPHRRGAPGAAALERSLTRPALGFLVFALTTYFVVVPARRDPAELELSGTHFLFYSILDLALALRFSYQAATAGPLRWRLTYASIAAFGVSTLIADGNRWLTILEPEPDLSHPANALKVLPFVFLILAQGFRPLPFAAVTERYGLTQPWPSRVSGSSGVTMVWALLLPLAHTGLYSLDVLRPASRQLRADLALGSVVLLGAVALLQQRLLESENRRLWNQRRRIEGDLRSSEKDLRLMVQRQRSREELARSEEKFVKAFRASPDGLAISTLEGGVLLDVNTSFERLTGRDRDALVGADGAELWPDPTARSRILDVLKRRGSVRDWESRMVSGDGRERTVVASFESIGLGEEKLLLTVLRDVTERRRDELLETERASAVDGLRAAVVAVDGDDVVVGWNSAAERLFRRDGAEALGTPWASLNVTAVGDGAAGLWRVAPEVGPEVDVTGRWIQLSGAEPDHKGPTRWWVGHPVTRRVIRR
ncbi:MAG: PAS domain S-box protein [Acidobacteriota bacterium]